MDRDAIGMISASMLDSDWRFSASFSCVGNGGADDEIIIIRWFNINMNQNSSIWSKLFVSYAPDMWSTKLISTPKLSMF